MENENFVIYGSVGLLIVSSLWLGGAIAAGVLIALISTLGVGLILLKIRMSFPKVWLWFKRHPLLADIIFSGGMALVLLNGSVTGLVSSAAVGIFVSLGLSLILNNNLTCCNQSYT